MCAAYNPPTEDITQFNSSLFNQPEEILSQAEANLLYLSKKNSDTSTAALTTFNNQVDIKGQTNFGTANQNSTTTIKRRLNITDTNGPTQGYGDIYYTGGQMEIISQSQSPSLLQTYVRFYTCAAGSTTILSRMEIADVTKIFNPVELTSSLYLKSGSAFTEMNQTGSVFTFANKTTSSTISMFCRTASDAPRGMTLSASSLEFNNEISLKTRQIKSTATTGAHTLFDDMTSAGTLTIGNALSTNQINGATTFGDQVTCKNLNLSLTGNASINCPNATGLDLFIALTTGTIGLFSNLSNGIINFCSSSVFTSVFNINSRIKHKQFQYLNEVKSVSGASVTLNLPLEQTTMLTSTSSTINVTLPALTLSSQVGFTFNVIKTGSITNNVIFTRSGTNLLRTTGVTTGSTSLTLMVNTDTIINMYSLEVSTGNFEWVLY